MAANVVALHSYASYVKKNIEFTVYVGGFCWSGQHRGGQAPIPAGIVHPGGEQPGFSFTSRYHFGRSRRPPLPGGTYLTIFSPVCAAGFWRLPSLVSFYAVMDSFCLAYCLRLHPASKLAARIPRFSARVAGGQRAHDQLLCKFDEVSILVRMGHTQDPEPHLLHESWSTFLIDTQQSKTRPSLPRPRSSANRKK